MAIRLPPLEGNFKIKKPSKLKWLPYSMLGIIVGLGFGIYLNLPSGPPTLKFLHGAAPIQHYRLRAPKGQGDIRTVWILKGTLENIKAEAAKDLTPERGWQPPTRLAIKTPNCQFVRVWQPGGAFQFTRVALLQVDPDHVEVEMTQDPAEVGRVGHYQL